MIFKRKGKILLGVFLAMSLLVFGASCSDDEDDEDQTSGVDFTNYSGSGNYSIKVKNNTTRSLVAFRGNPSKANLIGGIPASATNHALPKPSGMFSTSGDFILFVVTEDDYKQYKDGGDFSALANSPFARLYAYYNTDAENQIVYEISSVMGGSSTITLMNNTNYNVELRRDSCQGETIGYTPAQTLNTVFHVNPDNYDVFPVFRKYNAKMNEIVTVYPTYENGKPIIVSFNTISSNNIELNAATWSASVKFVPTSAYICIKNMAATGIRFYKGQSPLVTSKGAYIINSQDFLVYEIPMPGSGSGQNLSYAEKTNIAGYYIGTAGSDPVYINGDATTMKEIKAGYMYTLDVTGANYTELGCEWEDSEVEVKDDEGMEVVQ